MTQREIIQVGQCTVSYLLEGKDTHMQLCLFEFCVPVGAKVPVPHYHRDFDETVYGLEGTVTFTVDGKPNEVAPGEKLFIPRGAVHGFNNFGDKDVKALAVITPGILSPDFFREAGALLSIPGPPDVEKMKAVLLKHGLVPSMPHA
jgi:quercetin dioxygenase-like cupin family protein